MSTLFWGLAEASSVTPLRFLGSFCWRRNLLWDCFLATLQPLFIQSCYHFILLCFCFSIQIGTSLLSGLLIVKGTKLTSVVGRWFSLVRAVDRERMFPYADSLIWIWWFHIQVRIVLFSLYFYFRAATSSSWAAKNEAWWRSSSNDVGALSDV